MDSVIPESGRDTPVKAYSMAPSAMTRLTSRLTTVVRTASAWLSRAARPAASPFRMFRSARARVALDAAR